MEEHDCYGGQWTIHPAHDYQIKVPNWKGGGTAIVRCPGKTRKTVRDLSSTTLVFRTVADFVASGYAPKGI